jgi:hypothetical protein
MRDQVIRGRAIARRRAPWFRGNIVAASFAISGSFPADECQMNTKCRTLKAENLTEP